MDVRDIVWIASSVSLAAVYVLWHSHKSNRPAIDVIDLDFDRHSRRLELTVENPGRIPQHIRSCLRLVKYMLGEQEFQAEGVPMMAARLQSSDVIGYDLLAQDDHKTLVRGNTQEKFVYIVPENIILRPHDKIKVEVDSNQGFFSTVIPLKPKKTLVDSVVEAEEGIEDLIASIDDRISKIETQEQNGGDEIEKTRLRGEGDVLRDIEEELKVEKAKIDDSIKHLIGYSFGVGLSVETAS